MMVEITMRETGEREGEREREREKRERAGSGKVIGQAQTPWMGSSRSLLCLAMSTTSLGKAFECGRIEGGKSPAHRASWVVSCIR